MTAEELRKLIGCTVSFRGQRMVIAEVLDPQSQQPSLILQGTDLSIQADQWGEAHRRVPATIAVPVYDELGALRSEISSMLSDASRAD